MTTLSSELWHWATNAETVVVSCVRAVGKLIGSTEFISSLVGAFCGAGAAFVLESRRRRHEKKGRQHEALLRAQSALLAQGNSLSWFEAQYPDEDRFDNLKTIVLGFTTQTVDFAGIGFLGRSKRPQLIIDLDVANGSFEQFKRLAEFRNDTTEEFFTDPGTQVIEFDETTGRIRAVGPLRLKFKLRQANEGVAHAFEAAKERNKEAIAALLAFAHQEFSGMSTPYPSGTVAGPDTPSK
jgi:hypothetical protein